MKFHELKIDDITDAQFCLLFVEMGGEGVGWVVLDERTGYFLFYHILLHMCQ